MKYKEHNFERDSSGRIIIENFSNKVKTKIETKGKREKFWFEFDDVNVMFKVINDSTYEDYAELLAEELYKQMGIPCATYDLAVFKGTKGVLTPNFLNENETLVSGNVFITENLNILGIDSLKKTDEKETRLNNVLTIDKILKNYLTEEQYKKESALLKNIFGIYCMTLQGDIHWRNWSVVSNPKGDQKYKMSPLYDSAGMLRYSRGIKKLQGIFRGFITSNIENSRPYIEEKMFSEQNFDRNSILKYAPDSPSYMGITKFMEAFRRDPNHFVPVIKKLFSLDPEQAVKSVENKIGAEIPMLAKNWFIFVINRNKMFLNEEISNYYQKNSKKTL